MSILNKTKLYSLFFVFFLTFSACEHPWHKFTKPAFKTFKKSYKERLAKQKPLLTMIASGGCIGGKDGIPIVDSIDIDLYYPNQISNIDEARKLVLNNLLILVEEANKDVNLKKHLTHYPLKLQDLELTIHTEENEIENSEKNPVIFIRWEERNSKDVHFIDYQRESSKNLYGLDCSTYETIEEAVKKSGNPEFQKLLDYQGVKYNGWQKLKKNKEE